MELNRCATRFALAVCAVLLASCTQLSAVRDAVTGVIDAVAEDVAGPRDADAPEAVDPVDPVDPVDQGTDTGLGEGGYQSFVQGLMAESAELSDSTPSAARATRAATTWRGAGEESSEAQ